MSHWKQWAQDALDKMDRKRIDNVPARYALEMIRETGFEPYFRLKGFVAIHVDGDEAAELAEAEGM